MARVREPKFDFRSEDWTWRVGDAKTTLWHLDKLDGVSRAHILAWAEERDGMYAHPRYTLARFISQFTRGMTGEDTQLYRRRFQAIIRWEMGE